MPLSDLSIRSDKPGPIPIKLSDERGLFPLVQPSGGKLWRLKYRFAGKESKLSLGRYPDVGLKAARERCAEARQLIAAGLDPSEKKRSEKIEAAVRAATTFKAVGDEYIEKSEREGRASVTVGKARWLLSLLELALGTRPVDEITPVELLAALKKVEAKGHLETARRMRSLASRVFRYAVATRRASADPATVLRGALVAPVVTHHAAILDEASVGGLLRAIDGYDSQPMTQLALKLAPHVFVRPGTRPMSEDRINAALWRLGYSGKEMTGHGFRAMASILFNESGKWNPDAIERVLAHQSFAGVRAAYYRGTHWAERVEMAQWWSDDLDELCDAM